MDGRLHYLFELSRPRFWLYLAGPVAVGVAYGASATAELVTPTTLALFAFFLLPANVLLYGVNDIFDSDVDEENPKKAGREVRFEGEPVVLRAVGLCALSGLALVPFLPLESLVWLAGFYVLGIQYSAPPLRFKTTPLLDSVSNGLYLMPGAAAYAAVAGSHPPALAVAGAWLWTMAMHTFSAVPDIVPDRRAGIRTTATALGESRTYVYCAVCWALAALSFALLDPRLGALFSIYVPFVALIALSPIDVERAYWWFPALNTLVGMLLTMGGLWVLVHG
ncbi:prenyltransferase [Natronorarus salvus]|uniref:prenyltransferase n=1 Tax=Natronorarus salvus TaxID=3117733 RepID=UPI002F2652E4